MIRTLLGVAFAFMVGAGACSTFGSDVAPESVPDGGLVVVVEAGAETGPIDGTPADASFNVLGPSGRTYLVQAAKQVVKIHVMRGSAITGAITLALTGLPVGVTPTQALIPAGANDVELSLGAAADAPQGRASVKVEGVASGPEDKRVTASGSFELFVRGPSGATDTTFGTQGHVQALPAPATSDGLAEILVGPKDEIYIVAATYVTRRLPDGAIDTKFGAGGTVQTSGIVASTAVLQTDGRLVVGGTGTTKPVALFRLNPDGSPDATFGNAAEGPGTFSIKPASGTAVGAEHLALGANGSIAASFPWIIGGPGHSVAGVVRVSPTGAAVGTFGTNGLAMWDGNAIASNARALEVRPTGAVLVAGVTGTTVGTSYAATQLDSAGVIDTTFGTGGTLSASFPNANSLIPTHGSIAFLDGSLLYPVVNQSTGVVVKISAAGQFDNAFGSAGALELEGNGKKLAPLAVARTADGKVLVLAVEFGLPGGATLLRMAPNGTLDASFATGGRGVIATPSGESSGRLAAQSDGRILAIAGVDIVRVWN